MGACLLTAGDAPPLERRAVDALDLEALPARTHGRGVGPTARARPPCNAQRRCCLSAVRRRALQCQLRKVTALLPWLKLQAACSQSGRSCCGATRSVGARSQVARGGGAPAALHRPRHREGVAGRQRRDRPVRPHALVQHPVPARALPPAATARALAGPARCLPLPPGLRPCSAQCAPVPTRLMHQEAPLVLVPRQCHILTLSGPCRQTLRRSQRPKMPGCSARQRTVEVPQLGSYGFFPSAGPP